MPRAAHLAYLGAAAKRWVELPIPNFLSLHTFAERAGPADECTSALGHVTVAFSWLEQSLERSIALAAEVSGNAAQAITAEVPYRTKLSILSSLVRLNLVADRFNVGNEDPEEVWADILKMLTTAAELRNSLVHSHWQLSRNGQVMRRTRTTARAARGVRVTTEDLSSDYILDVYDYILNVDWVLNEFFNPWPTERDSDSDSLAVT